MQENNGSNQKQGGLSWSTPSSVQSTQSKTPAAPTKASTPAPVKTAPKTQAEQGGSPSRYVTMVILGIIAGAIIAWGYSAWHRPAKMTQSDTSGAMAADTTAPATTDKNLGVDTATMAAVGSDASLTIPSPQTAGTSVTVAKAIVAAPTWVVIYENNDGKPGNALGAALFFPDHQAGTVELLRSTTSGKSYLAVKQVDNGDRKFSLKDDQYLSEGNSVQWVTFQVK